MVSRLKKPAYLGNVVQAVADAIYKLMKRQAIKRIFQAKADSFIQAAHRLRIRLSELETCAEADIDRKLEQVISTVSDLDATAVHLPDVLSNVTTRELVPTLQDGLIRRLGKLARYHAFSRYLYQTAKNTSLFRFAHVTSVTLNRECFVRAPCPTDFLAFSDCLDRCNQGTKATQHRLLQKLGVSLPWAEREVTAVAKKAMRESKIHAEMQILAYYELNPAAVPPRVIASNKDACYLCDMAIRLHGKFHISKSHGRLYPGWRLPALPIYADLENNLIGALETRIEDLCREILASKKPVVNYPNESTIFHISTSMSTLRSLPGSRPVSPARETVASTSREGSCQRTSERPPFPSQPHTLPTVTERPAGLPTHESSTESDGSTERDVPSKGKEQEVHIEEKALPYRAGDSGVSGADEVEEIPPPSIDKGKGKAEDSTEQLTLPRRSMTTIDEEFLAAYLGPDNGIETTEDPKEEPASSLSEIGPSLEVFVQRLTENTIPEENFEGATTNDKSKGKQKATNISSEVSEYAASSMALPSRSPIRLSRGTTVKCRLNKDGWLPEYTAGLITIIPGCVQHKSHAGLTAISELHIEWLTDDEASDITPGRADVIDVQIMDEAVDINSGSPHLVIIKHGNVMVRMSVVRL